MFQAQVSCGVLRSKFDDLTQEVQTHLPVFWIIHKLLEGVMSEPFLLKRTKDTARS